MIKLDQMKEILKLKCLGEEGGGRRCPVSFGPEDAGNGSQRGPFGLQHAARKSRNHQANLGLSHQGIKSTQILVLKFPPKIEFQMEAPVNDLDSQGQNPLHYAVTSKDAEVLVPILIDAFCNVQLQRPLDGWTPLHLAVLFGKFNVVRCLVTKGE